MQVGKAWGIEATVRRIRIIQSWRIIKLVNMIVKQAWFMKKKFRIRIETSVIYHQMLWKRLRREFQATKCQSIKKMVETIESKTETHQTIKVFPQSYQALLNLSKIWCKQLKMEWMIMKVARRWTKPSNLWNLMAQAQSIKVEREHIHL